MYRNNMDKIIIFDKKVLSKDINKSLLAGLLP